MANIVDIIYRMQDRVTGQMAGIIKTSTQVAVSMQRTQKSFESTTNSVQALDNRVGMLSGGFDKLIKAGMAYFGIMETIRGTKAFLTMGMDMEQTRAKFEVLLGSLEKGNKMIADINQMANITPFENMDLIKSSELLLAFGVDANRIMPILNMLGDVAMGDKNKLSGLTLAFAQMSTAGRLMGQDLLQMVNVGFNPLTEISKKTGKSMLELRKEMEAGRISSQMVEDAFRTATSEGGKFYQMMDKMSQTGQGKLSTFLGDLGSKLRTLAEKFNPIIVKVMDFGIMVVKNFEKIGKVVWAALWPVRALFTGFKYIYDMFKNHIAIFAIIAAAWAYNAIVIWSNTLALNNYTIAAFLADKATKILKATFLTNPFTAALVVMSLLVGAIIMLRKQTEEENDELRDIRIRAAEFAAEEKMNLDMIFDKLRKTNPKSKERNELVKQLQDMYPGLLENMKLENASVDELGKAYKTLIDNIDARARTEALKERLTVIYKQRDTLAESNKPALDWLNKKEKEGTLETYMPGGINYEANRTLEDGSMFNMGVALFAKSSIEALNDKMAKIKAFAAGSEDTKAPNTNGGGGSGTGLGKESPEKEPKSYVSDLTGGGSKATNISVNFKNLIEQVTFKTETIKEGVDKVTDELIEGMLRVVNSANRIAER